MWVAKGRHGDLSHLRYAMPEYSRAFGRDIPAPRLIIEHGTFPGHITGGSDHIDGRYGRRTEDHYGEKGPQSHRQACGEPRPDAAHDAVDEPGKARRRSRSHVPAGAKIRK